MEQSASWLSSDKLQDVTNIYDADAAKLDEPTAVDILVQRAEAAKIASEVRTLDNKSPSRSRYVRMQLPNGRHTRQIVVFPRDVEDFLAIEFEQYIVLGDYVATLHRTSGRIEALVTGTSVAGRVNAGRIFSQLPGVEVITEGDSELDIEAFDDGGDPRRSSAENWRLSIEQDGVSIEISPASSEFQTLLERGVTIKIDGVTTTSHDEGCDALERYAAALLFDLDVVYGAPVQLAKRRRQNRRRQYERPSHPPRFPRNAYAAQALELYQYGRSAAGLPLLEYLAYYQSLEYFFPFFAKEQTVQSVRSELLHPGFDARNDNTLNRLINLAASAGRSGMAEREQLRATIRACMTEVRIRDFVESSEEYADHFCSKKHQAIKGVGFLQLVGNQIDIRDQVADRIYTIRCRIVHSKQDMGDKGQDVLLPSSAETHSLQSDVELIRLVAQSALVARAARA
ncbi:hypothetical protein [Arthrobacter sp. Helios]|uniref:hypothetical protein n=1 Tax=Arthrobacter sp. Helios TaxID=2828862 RepID=UPI002045FED2|nr:hypothetical protein [Arthrobacter sp. Helios]UPO76403.1 hypothetical protein ArtHe_13770 [Arthrobacter sp. Helios]